MIDLFPNGDQIRQQVRLQLADRFELARRIFEFALSISRNPSHAKRMPLVTANAGWALHVKACKQFRAIAILTEAACAGEAETLGRALLETFLSMHFIMRPRFSRWHMKNGRRRRIKGTSICREHRAMMAVAHGVLQVERTVERARQTPGLKRTFKRARAADVTTCEAILGTIVVKQLRKSSTCAGLSVADLAVSLGPPCQQMHALFYGDQSRRAHPSDMLEHIDMTKLSEPVGKWHSTIEDCCWAFDVASLVLLKCLECLREFFEFDIAIRHELASIGNEFTELRNTKA